MKENYLNPITEKLCEDAKVFINDTEFPKIVYNVSDNRQYVLWVENNESNEVILFEIGSEYNKKEKYVEYYVVEQCNEIKLLLENFLIQLQQGKYILTSFDGGSDVLLLLLYDFDKLREIKQGKTKIKLGKELIKGINYTPNDFCCYIASSGTLSKSIKTKMKLNPVSFDTDMGWYMIPKHLLIVGNIE